MRSIKRVQSRFERPKDCNSRSSVQFGENRNHRGHTKEDIVLGDDGGRAATVSAGHFRDLRNKSPSPYHCLKACRSSRCVEKLSVGYLLLRQFFIAVGINVGKRDNSLRCRKQNPPRGIVGKANGDGGCINTSLFSSTLTGVPPRRRIQPSDENERVPRDCSTGLSPTGIHAGVATQPPPSVHLRGLRTAAFMLQASSVRISLQPRGWLEEISLAAARAH